MPRSRSALVGATPLLLGELALTRFDALPVALTAASRRGAPRAAGRGSRRSRSGLAVAAKLYPLLLLPLVAIYVLRHARTARSGRRRSRSRRRPSRSSSCPFLALAPGEAWFSIRAQLTRGLQVESLPGSVVLALGRVGGRARPRRARHRRRRRRDRRRPERRRDRRARAGRRHARRARRGRGRRRDLGRRLEERRGASRGSYGTAPRSSRPRSRWGACSPRSSCSGSCPSCRSSRAPRAAGERASSPIALVLTHLWFPELYRDYVNERGAARDCLPARPERRAARAARLCSRRLRRSARFGRRAGRPRRSRTNAGATGTA